MAFETNNPRKSYSVKSATGIKGSYIEEEPLRTSSAFGPKPRPGSPQPELRLPGEERTDAKILKHVPFTRQRDYYLKQKEAERNRARLVEKKNKTYTSSNELLPSKFRSYHASEGARRAGTDKQARDAETKAAYVNAVSEKYNTKFEGNLDAQYKLARYEDENRKRQQRIEYENKSLKLREEKYAIQKERLEATKQPKRDYEYPAGYAKLDPETRKNAMASYDRLMAKEKREKDLKDL